MTSVHIYTCFLSEESSSFTAFLPPVTSESMLLVLYDAPKYFRTAPITSLGESTIAIFPARSGRHKSAQSCNGDSSSSRIYYNLQVFNITICKYAIYYNFLEHCKLVNTLQCLLTSTHFHFQVTQLTRYYINGLTDASKNEITSIGAKLCCRNLLFL